MADEYLKLSQAAKLLPNRPSTCTIWRWARRGVRARSGKRIRLHHVRIGGTIFVTREWLSGFMAELTAADLAHFEPDPDSPSMSPPGKPPQLNRRRKDHMKAEEALRRAGI